MEPTASRCTPFGLDLSRYLVFGIFGVSLFGGQFDRCCLTADFQRCNDDDVVSTNETIVGPDGLLYNVEYILSSCRTRTDCEQKGGVWASPTYGSFDDIPKAFNTLFEMSASNPNPTEEVLELRSLDFSCIYGLLADVYWPSGKQAKWETG